MKTNYCVKQTVLKSEVQQKQKKLSAANKAIRSSMIGLLTQPLNDNHAIHTSYNGMYRTELDILSISPPVFLDEIF